MNARLIDDSVIELKLVFSRCGISGCCMFIVDDKLPDDVLRKQYSDRRHALCCLDCGYEAGSIHRFKALSAVPFPIGSHFAKQAFGSDAELNIVSQRSLQPYARLWHRISESPPERPAGR
jgi:hypothetical protein